MPNLSASLESAERIAALPKTGPENPPYPARVSAEKMEMSKKTGAPMICLQFEIDEGEYLGRAVPGMNNWYYIMAGGKRENGMPHDLSRLFETINALKAEWTCTSCNTTSTEDFKKEKIKGSYHFLCPNCNSRAEVKLDGSWQGLTCRVGVDLEKIPGSEEDRNVITRIFKRD